MNVWQGLGDGKSISQKNGANAMKPHAFTLFLNKSTRLKNKNRLSKQVHIRDGGDDIEYLLCAPYNAWELPLYLSIPIINLPRVNLIPVLQIRKLRQRVPTQAHTASYRGYVNCSI